MWDCLQGRVKVNTYQLKNNSQGATLRQYFPCFEFFHEHTMTINDCNVLSLRQRLIMEIVILRLKVRMEFLHK